MPWSLCGCTFPGQSCVSSGWCCLAETITQAPAAYNSMLLVSIGVLLGIIAAAAVLFIVTRGKKK